MKEPIATYGDSRAEYAAIRDGGVGLIDLSARGRMSVSGTEAVMFLNGLITNDMKTLAENRWMPAAFANVQGRLLAAVRVARRAQDFLLETEAVTRESVLKAIERFTLAGDFRVKDLTDETEAYSLQGSGAAKLVEKVFGRAVAELPRDGVAEVSGATVIHSTHTGEDGFDFIVNSTEAPALWQTLADAGARPVGHDALEILRVEAGIARFGRDVDETNVVLETNLDEAVSYTKGCYLGQEIIVRIKHRGHVAKKLTGLRFETDRSVEPGAIIKSQDNTEIGRVTSSVFSPQLGTTVGLGYVRYEHLAPGTEVLVGDIAATTQSLPLVRGSWYQD